jgi:Co/Zn/Cd efflux system component
MSLHHDHDHAAPLTSGSTSGTPSSTNSGTTDAPPGYRRVLSIALAINMAMFVVELLAGVRSGSVSLLADAIDFFGDSANYAVSLAVLSAAPVWRTRSALLKGACMAAFGLFVLGRAAWSAWAGVLPDAHTMGVIGAVALVANLSVAWMLYQFRTGDANMRSVWLCSRNDAVSNIAVMIAALGVFGTQTASPDLLVASVMGGLALTSSWQVLQHARAELRAATPPAN